MTQTVIIAKGGPNMTESQIVFGPFERRELTAATSILVSYYPGAKLKRYQLQPLPPLQEEA